MQYCFDGINVCKRLARFSSCIFYYILRPQTLWNQYFVYRWRVSVAWSLVNIISNIKLFSNMTIRGVLVLLSVTMAAAQRPSFAGSRPIGFPTPPASTTTVANQLGDRFGEDSTTQRLPIEANGDRDLIDRLSKLPVDKQPFWFINWQAYEENRKKPQNYPQKPNIFAEQSGGLSVNPITVTSSNSNLGDRFAEPDYFGSLSNSNSGFTNPIPQKPSSLSNLNSNAQKGGNFANSESGPTVDEQYLAAVLSNPTFASNIDMYYFTNNRSRPNIDYEKLQKTYLEYLREKYLNKQRGSIPSQG